MNIDDGKPQPFCTLIIYSFPKNHKDTWAWIKIRTSVTARHHLIVVGGISLESVSHEESVGAGGDEGMTRSYNLKAQETECTQQRCWGDTKCKEQ